MTHSLLELFEGTQIWRANSKVFVDTKQFCSLWDVVKSCLCQGAVREQLLCKLDKSLSGVICRQYGVVSPMSVRKHALLGGRDDYVYPAFPATTPGDLVQTMCLPHVLGKERGSKDDAIKECICGQLTIPHVKGLDIKGRPSCSINAQFNVFIVIAGRNNCNVSSPRRNPAIIRLLKLT